MKIGGRGGFDGFDVSCGDYGIVETGWGCNRLDLVLLSPARRHAGGC